MGEEISAESDLTDLVIESMSEHWEPIRWSILKLKTVTSVLFYASWDGGVEIWESGEVRESSFSE